MTLHDHAGHRLTIGHPHSQRHRTVLWCDTCDQAVLPPELSAQACASEHVRDHQFDILAETSGASPFRLDPP